MLEKLFHLLSGYVEFRVKGDGARFFTIAAKRGIGFWGFRREGGEAVARAKPRTYRKLRPVCRRCGVSTRIIRKRGLPFQLRRLAERKGLVAGALCAAGLYWFLSGFLWGVSVSGAQLLSEKEILRAAEDYGVCLGGKKEALEPRSAGQGILAQLPGLSWVSVNTDGCFAQVAVKEGAAVPPPNLTGELSNIVAVREGQVVEIQAQEGRPEVAPGDTVKAGQLLIAGLYQEIPDPYGPQPDKLFQRAGAARGKVIARTYREFTVEVGSQTLRQREGERRETLWLNLFGLRIPLGLWSRLPDQEESQTVRTSREADQAELLGVRLPLALERERTVLLEEEEWVLNPKEQREAALRKLREAQRAVLPPGGEVEEEELEYTLADGMCILQARCKCREEIGEVRPIIVE